MTPKKAEFKKTYEIKNPRREETVTVEAVSENGLKANGKWYNFSKFKPEVKSAVAKGYTYKLTISTSTKDGKSFDNVIAAEVVSTPSKVLGPTAVQETKKQRTETLFGLTQVRKERDFDAEARGKSRCALFAAALQCPYLATLNNPDDVSLVAEQLANDGMNYVFPKETRSLTQPLQDGTAWDHVGAEDENGNEISPLDNL